MSIPGASGGAALRAAAAAGDAVQVGRLLGSVRCVRFSQDEHGRSALHLAASAGHTAVVRLLLNVAAPKEVDSLDGAGCTPLQRAAADGHEEVVRLLLSRGADVDKQDAVHGNCALHEAAWKGYSKTVALLASAGADLSKTNAGGFTALHLCCQNGHNQSCRELLLANCNPDLHNNYGDTALHTAARYGHAGVTRILISAKCRVSEQNKNGDTALHIAAAMGRRKLTRILLEANCDKNIRNKQNETARDIAFRKDLNEILNILDDHVPKSRDKKKDKGKKKSKGKVTFDGKKHDVTDNLIRTKHWSPYGCHYYPDPEAFPPPRLDTLPEEPLKRGEQYYLDLAGNIRKGPVGVGYTCYCAPLFRHLEARLEKDKRELHRAQVRLGQRVAGLEQKLNRTNHGRRSERITSNKEKETTELHRSRSLEMLDKLDDENQLQTTRSMDELDSPNQDGDPENRPSVKELVARIQHQHSETRNTQDGDKSESSDDEDSPLRLGNRRGPMGDSNLVSVNPNYENIPNGPPRSRSGLYSPTSQYIEPTVTIVQSSVQKPIKSRTFVSSAVLPNVGTSQNRDNDEMVMAHVRDQTASACIQSVPNLSACQSGSRYGSPYELQEPSCSNTRYGNPNVHYGSSNEVFRGTYYGNEPGVGTSYRNRGFHSPQFYEQNVYYADSNSKYNELQAKFARLRLLDSSKLYEKGKGDNTSPSFIETSKIFESTTRMLENPQDVIDRDTNNDSGYSTKVYGSSKGNSPCLSGQNENECLGSSSLV